MDKKARKFRKWMEQKDHNIAAPLLESKVNPKKRQ